MRLITIGDSYTNGDWSWPTPLANKLKCQLINLAIPAAQNSLNIKTMQEFIIKDNLNVDDIVIWQIGISWRPCVSLNIEKLPEVQDADKLMNYGELAHYTLSNKNMFDNIERINLLTISPLLEKYIDRKELTDQEQGLQELFFIFKIIKKYCPNLLILKANDRYLKEQNWQQMTNYLIQNNIDYINESIYNWCNENNLAMKDDLHPDSKSLYIYVAKIVYPKLKSLGWV